VAFHEPCFSFLERQKKKHICPELYRYDIVASVIFFPTQLTIMKFFHWHLLRSCVSMAIFAIPFHPRNMGQKDIMRTILCSMLAYWIQGIEEIGLKNVFFIGQFISVISFGSALFLINLIFRTESLIVCGWALPRQFWQDTILVQGLDFAAIAVSGVILNSSLRTD